MVEEPEHNFLCLLKKYTWLENCDLRRGPKALSRLSRNLWFRTFRDLDRLQSLHHEPACTDDFRKGTSAVPFLISRCFWTAVLRIILTWLRRKRTGLLLRAPEVPSLDKSHYCFIWKSRSSVPFFSEFTPINSGCIYFFIFFCNMFLF